MTSSFFRLTSACTAHSCVSARIELLPFQINSQLHRLQLYCLQALTKTMILKKYLIISSQLGALCNESTLHHKAVFSKVPSKYRKKYCKATWLLLESVSPSRNLQILGLEAFLQEPTEVASHIPLSSGFPSLANKPSLSYLNYFLN